MDDQTTSIGRIVPYLLFVGSVFITGFVFVMLNIPLAWQFARTPYPVDAVELLRRYADLIKAFVATGGSASVFLVLVLACLVSGFVVNMISEGIATIVGCLVMGLARAPVVTAALPDLRLFTYATYFEDGHATFRLWLLSNQPARLQWEWELFNFTLYWGLTTNLLIALCTARALTGSVISFIFFLGLITCTYSLLRSWVLFRFHQECVESMRSCARQPSLTGNTEEIPADLTRSSKREPSTSGRPRLLSCAQETNEETGGDDQPMPQLIEENGIAQNLSSAQESAAPGPPERG